MKYTFSSISQKLVVTLDTESGLYKDNVTYFSDPSVTLENDKIVLFDNSERISEYSFRNITTINSVAPTDINDAFINVKAFLSFLAEKTIAPFLGAITPTSTPTGTGEALWVATEAGTYTNFGGVVVGANSRAEIARDAAGAFSISKTPLDLSTYQKIVDGNKINFWQAIPYAVGSQTNKDGKDWYLPTVAALSTDVPGVSSKWVERLSAYANKINVGYYNVTTEIPLTAGSFYTAATARTAVQTAGVHKLGMKITYATAVNVWIEEQFTGASASTGWVSDYNWVSTQNIVSKLISVLPSNFAFYDKDGLVVTTVTAANGIYFNQYGTTEVGAAVAITGFIPVTGGLVYQYTGDAFPNGIYQNFYDANNVYISGVTLDGANRFKTQLITAPTNAAFIRCSVGALGLINFRLTTDKNSYQLYVDSISKINSKVDASVSQTLTTAQKLIARTNIDASSDLDLKSILSADFTFYDKDGLPVTSVTTTNGIYLDQYGTTGTGAALAITGYIPIIGDSSYKYTGDTFSSSIYQHFYDIDKLYISGVAGNLATRYDDLTMVAPTNAVFIRCCVGATKLASFKLLSVSNSHNLEIINKIAKGVFVSSPTTIPIVIGNQLEIFKQSLINAINPDNYFLSIRKTTGTLKGNFYDRVLKYTPITGDAAFSLRWILRNDNYVGVAVSETLNIVPIIKKSSPATAKNILVIGDSFSAYNFWIQEFKRRLTASGGVPIADGLTNLNFIGTKCTTAGLVPCEAVGGKDYPYWNSAASPFYNPTSGLVDFNYYCTQNGYANIDYCIIILGTNGSLEANTQAEIVKMWDALLLKNPSIKVLVGGRILPSPYGGAGSSGIINNQTYYGLAKDAFKFNRTVEALAQTNTYKNNFFFADILPSFDILNNMPYTMVNANNRNSDVQVRQGSDNVHPALSGYYQISDTMYNAFHYWCLV